MVDLESLPFLSMVDSFPPLEISEASEQGSNSMLVLPKRTVGTR